MYRYLDIYNENTATIKLHKVSYEIRIKKGIRQDDTISLKLFSTVIEEVFKNMEWEKIGIRINGIYQNKFRFAVDIVLMSESIDELQQMIL